MQTSPGKKYKKGRLTKEEQKLKQLTVKIHGKKYRRVDWVKLEKYKNYRLEGLNRYRSAKLAGYSESVARHQATRYDRLSSVGIIEALENAGVSNTRQAEELARIAFKSVKTEDCEVYRENEDGDIVVEKAGKQVPDDYARLKGLDQIGRLKKQISAPFEKTLLQGGYKRLVIVVENDQEQSHSDEIGGRADKTDSPPKFRVETTDE